MTLLAPAALVGLLLLAVPIVVHLLRPRKMRQTPFSSLRWLKVTRQRLSRRIQWHQWLLFLLRAAFVVLLVLALARPMLGLWPSQEPIDRFVIVDTGRAMAYETAEGTTPLERAKEIAVRIAEHARPGDRTAVLLAGGPPKLLMPPTADPAAHLAGLRTAAAQASEQSVTEPLALLPALLGSPPARDVELVFVTANQRHVWRPGEIHTFAQAYGTKSRVQVIDVGPGTAANGWIAGARLVDRGPAADRVLRVDLGAVGTRQARVLRLTGVEGVADDTRDVTLQPGRPARVDFVLPASVPLAGQVAELRLEPADALPSDDRWFVNLDAPWALRLLLIGPASDGPELPGPGLYLRTALEALAASGDQAFRLESRTGAAVTATDVRDADVVLLAGVPKLAEEVTAALEKRVAAGAGLIAFVGPQLDVPFYRERLFRPVQPDTGLLPMPLRVAPETYRQGGPSEWRQVRWTHPLLAPLRDPLLGDVSLCRFLKYAAFDAAASKDDAVLARFEDDTPALVDRPFGTGRVLFWNTTPDDRWSDLPRRRCFVPLVDRMLAYLTAGGVRRQFTVGAPIRVPVPGAQAGETVTLTAPDGGRLLQRLQPAGTQAVLHLDAAALPGVYRIAAKGWAFAVNTGRDASPLTPTDPEALKAWWSPAPVEVVGGDAALAQQEAQSSGWPIWPALIVIAGLVLLAETIYVYRLCPRGNPVAATPVVPAHNTTAS